MSVRCNNSCTHEDRNIDFNKLWDYITTTEQTSQQNDDLQDPHPRNPFIITDASVYEELKRISEIEDPAEKEIEIYKKQDWINSLVTDRYYYEELSVEGEDIYIRIIRIEKNITKMQGQITDLQDQISHIPTTKIDVIENEDIDDMMHPTRTF